MASFTVRVELHGALADDYEELHSRMETAGFSRAIVGGNGTYQLPTAEYNFFSDTLDTGDVVEKAYAVAESVRVKPWVLVTKAADRMWKGLKKV